MQLIEGCIGSLSPLCCRNTLFACRVRHERNCADLLLAGFDVSLHGELLCFLALTLISLGLLAQHPGRCLLHWRRADFQLLRQDSRCLLQSEHFDRESLRFPVLLAWIEGSQTDQSSRLSMLEAESG